MILNKSNDFLSKKLLVMDVEGTIFKTKIRLPGTKIDSTIWQAIAYCLGEEAIQMEVNTHKKWEEGSYNNYLEWMTETIEVHKKFNLKKELFEKIIYEAEYNENVIEVINSINRSKYEIVLVSGGFLQLAKRAQIDLNIKHAFAACDYIFSSDGTIISYNLLPCDFDGKIKFIEIMMHNYKINTNDWVFIGDGANDVNIAKLAPFSIAYNAHEDLKKVSSISIDNYKELFNIL